MTQFVGIGGDLRSPRRTSRYRKVPRAFARSRATTSRRSRRTSRRLDAEGLVSRFRLPVVEPTRRAVDARLLRSPRNDGSAHAGLRCVAPFGALDRSGASPKRRSLLNFEHQVLASAESLGHRFRFDKSHGRHVRMLATQLSVRSRLQDEHRFVRPRSPADANRGVAPRHRRACEPSRITSTRSTFSRRRGSSGSPPRNQHRRQRRPLPSRQPSPASHLAYLELDQHGRLLASKLAALLRVADTLDAGILAKVREGKLVRDGATWVLRAHRKRRHLNGADRGNRADRYVRRGLRSRVADSERRVGA